MVEQGLARSRAQAGALIRDGSVSVDGRVATKASEPVTSEQQLGITEHDHYVSRGAHKLLGALADLGSVVRPVAGLRILDAGASTGGFTQVLLELDAATVIAVDVGHDQLHPQLRSDARVQSFEQINLRELDLDLLGGEPVDLVVADVSFISLRMLLGPLVSVSAHGGQLLIMVKPQFEVGRAMLGKGGVVRDPDLHRRAVSGVLAVAEELGWSAVAAAPSRLPGPAGNQEFFVLLEPGPGTGFDWPVALGL